MPCSLSPMTYDRWDHEGHIALPCCSIPVLGGDRKSKTNTNNNNSRVEAGDRDDNRKSPAWGAWMGVLSFMETASSITVTIFSTMGLSQWVCHRLGEVGRGEELARISHCLLQWNWDQRITVKSLECSGRISLLIPQLQCRRSVRRECYLRCLADACTTESSWRSIPLAVFQREV